MVRRLLLLNGFAIIAVVIFHATGWGFVAMFSWTHRYMAVTSPNYDQLGSIWYYMGRIVEQFVVFSVPAFLFVSGFFIAFATGRTRPNVKWDLIKSRIQNLLIPYLLWSFALFALYFIQGTRYSPGQYLILLITGKTNPAYYFVPLLVQYYLLSPIIVPLAKKNWLPLLVVTFIIQLSVQILYYPDLLGLNLPNAQLLGSLIPKWFFPSRLFWFTFGVIIGFHYSEMKAQLAKYKWFFIGFAILLLPLGVLEWEYYLKLSGKQWMVHRETIIDTAYTIFFILSFITIDKISDLPFSKKLDTLGSKSYGIYLIHSPVMEYTARGIYHLAPWILGYQILFQPIIVLTGLGIPLLMMSIVAKSPVRKYYQYLFG